MKSRKNQIKSILIICTLCFSGLFFNSCQTSEDEIIFSSSELFTKDSKIVPLFLKALGASDSNTKAFSKSSVDDQQCTEFVYPITFFAYGNDAEEPSAVVINNDEEFVAFLASLTSGEEFFMTYPMTLVDVDGVETVINDYPDLEGILTMLVNACSSGDDDDDNDDDDNGDDDDNDDTVEYEYCGNNNKKVVICHNGQSICISINAIWGHMAHHADDYFGSCNN